MLCFWTPGEFKAYCKWFLSFYVIRDFFLYALRITHYADCDYVTHTKIWFSTKPTQEIFMPTQIIHGACPHDCPDTCGIITEVENFRKHGQPADDITLVVIKIAA